MPPAPSRAAVFVSGDPRTQLKSYLIESWRLYTEQTHVQSGSKPKEN